MSNETVLLFALKAGLLLNLLGVVQFLSSCCFSAQRKTFK